MLDTLKTFSNAIIDKAKTFKGDWSENDQSSPNYIKNKTHWSEKSEVTLYNDSPTFEGNGSGLYLYDSICDFSLVLDKIYTIIFDGTGYSCRSMQANNALYIGNISLMGESDDTGEPFLIICGSDSVGVNHIMMGTTLSGTAHTVTIKIVDEVIHKLDEKYLPDTISSHIENDVIHVTSDDRSVWDNKAEKDVATTSANGLMSKADKVKLNSISSGANKITVDTALSGTSTNPVQNKIINTALNNKMDKTNPTGTGSFSLNRKSSTYIGNYSFAEGYDTTASGNYSHAEGNATTASKNYSHAEGNSTTASGESSHAEGESTTASGMYGSHAEGNNTTASGAYSSHAEGHNTTASGDFGSHAEGYYTIASSPHQHVQGSYNIADSSGTYADIIGNGTSDTNRSNVATVTWSGDAWFARDVYVDSTSGKNKDEGSKKLATENYVSTQISTLESDLTSHTSNKSNPHEVTKAQVGLDNVTNDAQVKRTEMGTASGVATLDTTGKVPSSQLPSYVDDVIEGYLSASKFYATKSGDTYSEEITGESGKIYVDLDTNKTYR